MCGWDGEKTADENQRDAKRRQRKRTMQKRTLLRTQSGEHTSREPYYTPSERAKNPDFNGIEKYNI